MQFGGAVAAFHALDKARTNSGRLSERDFIEECLAIRRFQWPIEVSEAPGTQPRAWRTLVLGYFGAESDETWMNNVDFEGRNDLEARIRGHKDPLPRPRLSCHGERHPGGHDDLTLKGLKSIWRPKTIVFKPVFFFLPLPFPHCFPSRELGRPRFQAPKAILKPFLGFRIPGQLDVPFVPHGAQE